MTCLLCTERENLSCLQILTLSIPMAKMQRQEKALYVQTFIYTISIPVLG